MPAASPDERERIARAGVTGRGPFRAVLLPPIKPARYGLPGRGIALLRPDPRRWMVTEKDYDVVREPHSAGQQMPSRPTGPTRAGPASSARSREDEVDGQLVRREPRIRPESQPAGITLAQAITSLADEFRRVSVDAHRGHPGLQVDPVEVTLQVAASRTTPQATGVEWRVLAQGDERHASVAHTLKLRWGWDSPEADPAHDAAGQNPARPGRRPGRDSAPEHDAGTAPDLSPPGGSASPPGAERAAETARGGVLRLTVYLLRDRDAENRESRLSARLLVKREVVTARSAAEVADIGLLRSQYENADISDRGERLRAAAADYFAGQVEGKLNISWWDTRDSFPFSKAADDLNNAAELLRSWAERPLTTVAHAAGAGGPAVSMLTGITEDAATARLTAPLENAARVCEVAGVLIGLATGVHPLVVACGNRLAHDLLGQALAGAFERMPDSEAARRERAAGERHGVQAAGRAREKAAETPGRSATSAAERDKARDQRIIDHLIATGELSLERGSGTMRSPVQGERARAERDLDTGDDVDSRDDPSARDDFGAMG